MTTPAAQVPYAEQPALQDRLQPPATPTQPALNVPVRQCAQAPANESLDTATPPDQAPAQSACNNSLQQPLTLSGQAPDSANTAQLPDGAIAWSADDTALLIPPAQALIKEAPQLVQDAANLIAVAETADFADTTAVPSPLTRELAVGDAPGAEPDEADKALSTPKAQLPVSAQDISAPAQQALIEAPRSYPIHSKVADRETWKDAQENDTPMTPRRSSSIRRVQIADQPEASLMAKLSPAEGVPAEKLAVLQDPKQANPIGTARTPASGAASAPDQIHAADKGKVMSCAVAEQITDVGSDPAGEAESSNRGPRRMHTVEVALGDAARQLEANIPLLELKSLDPELLEAARQQRSVNMNSAASTDMPLSTGPLSDEPFFEIRGPASSPDELLKQARLYLLAGESPHAPAADPGMVPISRAKTVLVSGPPSATAPDLEPEESAENAASQHPPRQSAGTPQTPTSSAASVCDQAPVARKGKAVSRSMPQESAELHNNKAGERSARENNINQVQTVKMTVGAAGSQQQEPENPFFELKSFDPELLEAARQQRSMSLNSAASTDMPLSSDPLPDNPFFEIRGPASSPDELLKHATLYLLAGESPNATAADLGKAPISRANTEPVSGPVLGQQFSTAPGLAKPALEPKTPRQAGMQHDALAPAISALPSGPLASVPEPAGAELSDDEASGSFLDPKASAELQPETTINAGDDAPSRQSSRDTSSGKSSDIYLPAWKDPQVILDTSHHIPVDCSTLVTHWPLRPCSLIQ